MPLCQPANCPGCTPSPACLLHACSLLANVGSPSKAVQRTLIGFFCPAIAMGVVLLGYVLLLLLSSTWRGLRSGRGAPQLGARGRRGRVQHTGNGAEGLEGAHSSPEGGEEANGHMGQAKGLMGLWQRLRGAAPKAEDEQTTHSLGRCGWAWLTEGAVT